MTVRGFKSGRDPSYDVKMTSNAQTASPTFDRTFDTAELSDRAARRLALLEQAWAHQALTETEYGTLRGEILTRG